MQEHGIQALKKHTKCILTQFQNVFTLIFSLQTFLSQRIYYKTECAGDIKGWLTPVMMLASRHELICVRVSPVPRLVHPQLLPTPLSCCHVAMATWEGPAFTTPGSQRRTLVWGKGCGAVLVSVLDFFKCHFSIMWPKQTLVLRWQQKSQQKICWNLS